jgi:hypothetical protein
MRKAMFLASIGIFLAIGARNAAADTITTGNLSFACFVGECVQNGDLVGTAPTAGSFVYDNTTNQFLTITITWDGITLYGFHDATGQETAYLELIGSSSSPLMWNAVCTAGTIIQGHCGGEFGFSLFDQAFAVNMVLAPLDTPMPTFPNDASAGTVTATDLVTTPEPGATGLLLLGIGVALAAGKKRLADRSF